MRKLFAQRCARLGSQNEFKIVDDIAKAEAMGQQVVRLNLGEPDNDSAGNIKVEDDIKETALSSEQNIKQNNGAHKYSSDNNFNQTAAQNILKRKNKHTTWL